MTDPIGAPDVNDVPSTTDASFSRRLAGPSVLRLGVVVLAAVALLATAAFTIGASPSPSTGTNDPSTVLPPMGGAAGGPGGLAGPGGFGGGRGFGRNGLGEISITAVDGSNLSLKTADGWTRTIATTAATQITKGGKTIAVGDLKAGDQIVFAQTRNSDGSYTITAVHVVLPRVGGTVSAKTATSITVKQRDGSSATITVDSSTSYHVQGVTTASLSDVTVGMWVVAEGTTASDGSLTASQVQAAALGVPGFGGGRMPGGWGPGGPLNPNPSASPTTNG